MKKDYREREKELEEKIFSNRRRRGDEDWEEAIERRARERAREVEGRGRMMASIMDDDDEEEGEEERAGRRVVIEEEENEINIESLQEIKNLILHQLVISYNLSKVSQHVVDRVLNHLSKEERIEKSLQKIEEMIIDVVERIEEKKSKYSKFVIWMVLILQVLNLFFLLFFLLLKH